MVEDDEDKLVRILKRVTRTEVPIGSCIAKVKRTLVASSKEDMRQMLNDLLYEYGWTMEEYIEADNNAYKGSKSRPPVSILNMIRLREFQR